MKFHIQLRHPKTTQEKKANQEQWHRTKRKVKTLPSAWDDISYKIQKSWKAHRKTRYKPKQM